MKALRCLKRDFRTFLIWTAASTDWKWRQFHKCRVSRTRYLVHVCLNESAKSEETGPSATTVKQLSKQSWLWHCMWSRTPSRRHLHTPALCNFRGKKSQSN